MSLSVYRGKQKKEALAKLPESGYYWKVVKVGWRGGYFAPLLWQRGYFAPLLFSVRHEAGWNITKKVYNNAGYALAYHLYRHKRDAERWKGAFCKTYYPYKIIRCKVEKKDIINIGMQDGYTGAFVIVATRFWCPKPEGERKC